MALELKKLKNQKIDKNNVPIAIVKAEDKKVTLNHNKLLFMDLDKLDKPNEIVLKPNETFELLPNPDPNKRNLYYIAGSSGSGKSYITVKIVQNYQRLFPDRKIFLVSGLEEDETIDRIPNLVRLTDDDIEDFDINNPIFSDSFFIFDDWENLDNLKPVEKMIKNILIMGRKHKGGQGNISAAILSHQINRGKGLGTLILNESTHYILYPTSTSHHSLNYILGKYVGMEEKEIRSLKKVKSRWVAVHKNYPNYLLSSYTAKLLHQD